jgi:hypothetical protein
MPRIIMKRICSVFHINARVCVYIAVQSQMLLTTGINFETGNCKYLLLLGHVSEQGCHFMI